MAVSHGQRVAAILIKRQDLLRQSLRFLAEDQEVTWPERGFSIRPFDLGRKEKESSFILRLQESVEIIPIDDIDMLPVVKAGPFQMLVGRRKTKRPDQMHGCIGSSAQSGD